MNLQESLDAVHQKYKKNKLSAFNELLNVTALFPKQMKEIASFIVGNAYHKNSKNKAKKNAYPFWKSDFVSKHFAALIKTSSACDLLDGYFNQLNYHRGYYLNSTIIETAFKENASLLVQVILHTNTLFEVKHLKHILRIPSLCKMLYSEKEMLFVKTVKLSRLFLEEKYLNSLSQYVKSQLKLEFHYWYKQEKKFEAIAKEYHDKELQKYTIEELLILICAFNERKKVNSINVNNRANLISHESTLCKISNQIIQRRLDLSKESGLEISSLTEFNQKVKSQIPPRNTIKGLFSKSYIPEKAGYKMPFFFQSLQFYFSWFGYFYFEMSIYCGNYSDLNFSHDGIYSIPRKEFANNRRDDAKIRYLEYYMSNNCKTFSAKENIKKNYKQLKTDSGLLYQTYFKELGLPETIKSGKNKKINIYKVFVLLGIFSDLVAPPIRQYEKFGPFYKKGKLVKKFNFPESFLWTLKHDSQHGYYHIGTPNKPKDWTKLFKGKAINRFEEKDLINSLCRLLLPLRLGYTREEIIDILNFLTTDFSERYLNLQHRPFIKIQDKYYWQGSLYRDRHWGNIMYHRISKESLQDHPKLQADILEKKIADLFENVGAKVLKETSDREYKTIDNEYGEFDGVCYFKESNTLVLVELKTTFINENIEKYARYAYDKFEVQAKKQLLRGIHEINTNFDKYKKLLGLQKGYNVVPLIVSNIFYEDRIMIDGILKLSYLELMVILKNNKDDLMSFQETPIEHLHRSQNQNALHYKGEPLSNKNTNLWKDPNKFSIEDLLENNVWDFIDKSFDYEQFLFHSTMPNF